MLDIDAVDPLERPEASGWLIDAEGSGRSVIGQ
jgi:hypothetical protein